MQLGHQMQVYQKGMEGDPRYIPFLAIRTSLFGFFYHGKM